MPRKRKKSGSRKLEKRLFIVCEGKKDKSESAYFKALIKDCKFAGEKVEVKVIDTRKNTGKELVKEAKKIKEFSMDEAWVVYDMNGYTKHPETFSIAKNSKINIAFSAISFETWILLHFKYTSKAFLKSEDLIKYINKNNYINYHKDSQDIYIKTRDKIDTAIKNAIQLQKNQIKGNPEGTAVYLFNPYTNINELLDAIYKLQELP